MKNENLQTDSTANVPDPIVTDTTGADPLEKKISLWEGVAGFLLKMFLAVRSIVKS